MAFDEHTPRWVQHLAFQVADNATLEQAQQELLAKGVEVLGPTDHGFLRSIYFFDPSGHRLELAAPIGSPEMLDRLRTSSGEMLEQWAKTKTVQRQAAWVHVAEFASGDAAT